MKNAQELAARLQCGDSGADVDFSDFQGQSHGTVIAACISHGIEMMLLVSAAVANH